MWCLVIKLASHSMSLTLVTNRISLLLLHVLPQVSQAVTLCKLQTSLRWSYWPKVGGGKAPYVVYCT